MHLGASRLGDDAASPDGARAQEGHILTKAQLAALERVQREKEAHGDFESECPGYCGAQDTFDVGTLKGVGQIYQQPFIDTYTKVGFAKLYTEKTPITAADLLNDRVRPFFDLLNECYRVAFRKRPMRSLEALQTDLDYFIAEYNAERPHQGRWGYGKTPMQTFLVIRVPWVNPRDPRPLSNPRNPRPVG